MTTYELARQLLRFRDLPIEIFDNYTGRSLEVCEIKESWFSTVEIILKGNDD